MVRIVALYANDLDDKLGLIVTQPQLTLWVLLALPSLVRHPWYGTGRYVHTALTWPVRTVRAYN